MNRLLFLPALAALLLLTGSISLARTPVVLELFTSEGCSSCPPADKLLQTLDRTQPFAGVDLIVLSEHVDYWNGTAWKDPYSSTVFTERQSHYAERLGVEAAYTPQLVIDGRLERVGNNAASVNAAIEKALAPPKLRLSLANVAVRNGKVTFRAASPDATPPDLTLYIALAEDNAQSNVRGGENGGRLLSHVAVVRSLTAVGSVPVGVPLDKAVSLPLPRSLSSDSLRVVAFLQASRHGAIVAAAQSRLPTRPLQQQHSTN